MIPRGAKSKDRSRSHVERKAISPGRRAKMASRTEGPPCSPKLPKALPSILANSSSSERAKLLHRAVVEERATAVRSLRLQKMGKTLLSGKRWNWASEGCRWKVDENGGHGRFVLEVNGRRLPAVCDWRRDEVPVLNRHHLFIWKRNEDKSQWRRLIEKQMCFRFWSQVSSINSESIGASVFWIFGQLWSLGHVSQSFLRRRIF